MSARPNADHAITQWLRDEADAGAPDRLIAAVRTNLESTDQRRTWWPARRFEAMNSISRLAAVIGAVALVAVVALIATPRFGGTGQPQPSPSPSASAASSASLGPSASPKFLGGSEGRMAPGSYFAMPFVSPISALRVTFNVPTGYSFVTDWAIIPDSGSTAPQGAGIGFLQPNGLFSDPCHWDLDKDGVIEAGDVPTGSSVDDLVTALRAQTAYGVTLVGDTGLGGYRGKRVDLQLPTPLDVTKCDKPKGVTDVAPAFVWGPAQLGAADLYIQGSGNRWQVYVLDVDGDRVVVVLQDFATTPASRQTEMRAILDSLRFEP